MANTKSGKNAPKDLATQKQILDARSNEREQAAVVAETFGGGFAGQVGKEIAAKIRKGGES